MEKTFTYVPQNVCSRQMSIVYDGDTIVSVTVLGGCNGNLQGVSRLVKGRKIDEIIATLDGIRCPGSRTKITSCPDQLAQALKALKAAEGK
jgi:uncharacterized protein (TIGR03905 family)